jgi:hypothetical protein
MIYDWVAKECYGLPLVETPPVETRGYCWETPTELERVFVLRLRDDKEVPQGKAFGMTKRSLGVSPSG